MEMQAKLCEHLAQFELKKPDSRECAECIKTGARWVHLRICQSCGVTLCCDSSPNKHASRHASSQNHPVAVSAEPGEKWAWCYTDHLAIVDAFAKQNNS